MAALLLCAEPAFNSVPVFGDMTYAVATVLFWLFRIIYMPPYTRVTSYVDPNLFTNRVVYGDLNLP